MNVEVAEVEVAGRLETAPTGAHAIVDALQDLGVDLVFGLPGDTGVDLYDALASATTLRHVLTRDERHACFMGDAYARATGRPGVVEVSSGGGVMFAVSGLGEAFAASIPVFVITSDIHTRSAGTGALTEIDQELLFSAVSVWTRTAESATELGALVKEGFRATTAGRPGPAVLIVPEDVLAAPAPRAPATGVPRVELRPSTLPPVDDLRACVDALSTATQPLLVVGGGIHMAGAWDSLDEFANRMGVPVATSIQGKGAVSDESPWSLGVLGANGARDYANEYAAAADVVVFVGTRANATDTNSFRSPRRESRTFGIDIDAVRACRNYPAGTKLVGDAGAVLRALAELAPPAGTVATRSDRLRQWIRVERTAWDQRVAEADRDGAGAIPAYNVFRAVQEAFRSDDLLIVADCGTPTPYLAAYWESPQSGRNIVMARGHGPMGYAIPAAVSCALSTKKQVVCFTTDGSFLMACGELETAARLELPIRFVYLDNSSLGWIKMLQHLYFGRRYHGVDGSTADPVPVCAGFGVQAERCDTLEALTETLARHRRLPGPTLAHVRIPEQSHEVPPVAPWQSALKGGAREVY